MSQHFENAAACWKVILSDVKGNTSLLGVIERFARENRNPIEVVFGTSGWRGEIGTDFTFHNVRIVTAAIVEMFRRQDPAVMKAMGVPDFDEICRRGVVVGHDNRFLGPEFAMEVIGLLNRAGIRTWYAGETPTPEFSTAVEMLQAACSVNLTPSHNPANYAGFKFNPSDGGPAGPEITKKIEEIANEMMRAGADVRPVPAGKVEPVDTADLYIKYVTERKTLDLDRIRRFVAEGDLIVCVDNVHGSTRGRIERLLGQSDKIVYLRKENDFLFGGVAPEPSEKNMEGVDAVLRKSGARFKLGVIMDPDGDRIRHSDGVVQVPMNYFGALAFHFLHVHKGFRGIIAKSVATSNFVNAIAEKLGVPVRETEVGFKNFRPYMLKTSPERAVIAFEESDGISGFNHTLEKDALFGFLIALEMMAVSGKNLSAYLRDTMAEFGAYYPDRSGISVDRSLVGAPLLKKLSSIRDRFAVGTDVDTAGVRRVVRDVITVDGTKIVLDDGSWLMIRPSGTEPKVRFYIEARTEEQKRALFETAERMTKEALS